MKKTLATLALGLLAVGNASAAAAIDISTETAALKDELVANIPKAMAVGLVALAFVVIYRKIKTFAH